MATKYYVDLADLTLFKNLQDSETAEAIATAEAKSLHTVAIDGTTLKFYREEEPVGSATPAYSVSLPQQDLSNYLQKIASATGAKVLVSRADGTFEESVISVSEIALSANLAAVATSGDAEDVAYDNTSSGLTADDVQDAIDELAAASSGGVASKTVYLQDETTGQSDYAKVYKLYQGANAPDAQTSPASLIGTINIPKDLVVSGGSVVTVSSGVDSEGDTTSVADGTYVKLRIQNQTNPLYINVADLIDVYTAEASATQVQLAISATNEISATIVAGSIGTTELADDSVTAAKISIAAHSESQTAGADGLAISVTTTDGQVSAVSASIAANTYEAYGAATAAVEALDADLDASGTAQHGGVFVVSGVTQVDGAITSVDSVEVEVAGAAAAVVGTASDTKTANTVYGAKAYADDAANNATASVAEADIRALFSSPSV